ncbi:hypothetical protein RB195_007804 [Necator americanus]|uniref:Homeobox domain-containing protein n=1 Tax=Necator americanus TaxID=51031 RepID=A0ABR1C2E9_NECAM
MLRPQAVGGALSQLCFQEKQAMKCLIYWFARKRRRHAIEAIGEIIEEGDEEREVQPVRRQEEEESSEGELLGLHLPCAQAGAPRHRRVVEGDVDHEFVRERRLRTHRR